MSKKLLLADDSVTIQKVIQITFAHEDYDLTVTDNGDAAFDKAREIKPDLVLADVYMPGKNGYELCSALKQDPAFRGMPVLLLTGSFEPFDEDKARAVKADAWLEKPFESQTLLDKVAELLQAAEASSPAETGTDEDQASQADADQFEDFSFEEEPSVEQAADAAPGADDWSDLSDFTASAAAEMPAPEEISAETFDEPQAAPTAPEVESAASAGEFEPGEEAGDEDDDDMFIFEDDLPEEEAPEVAVSEPDGFDADDDIMALDDEDILGAEDLEPLDEEPTLAAWSREDFAGEESSLEDFDEPGESLGMAGEAVSDLEADEDVADPAASGEGALSRPEEPAFGEDLAGAEPEFSTAFAEAPTGQDAEETSDAVGTAFEPTEADEQPFAETSRDAGAIETQAGRLSEAEIEAIVEQVAGKVIEKMAGTILERIAWEVVPDLAESLIREEINKIKGAAA